MRFHVLLLAGLLAAVPLASNASAATVAAVDHCGSGYYAQVGSLSTACAAFAGPVRPVPCGSSGTRVVILTATTTCLPVTPIIVSTCAGGVQARIGSATTTCIPAVGGPTVYPCPGGYYIDWPPLFTTTCLPGVIGGPTIYPCPGGYSIDWPPLFTTTCLPPAITVTPCPGGYQITIGTLTTTCLP